MHRLLSVSEEFDNGHTLYMVRIMCVSSVREFVVELKDRKETITCPYCGNKVRVRLRIAGEVFET